MNIKILPKNVFVLLFCFCFGTYYGQKYSNTWYFGYKAGIDFNSGKPQLLKNSAMSAVEGCSSISDEDGKILFYTDGDSTWNNHHKIMPHGTGLMGHWSSTQGAMIIPVPSEDKKFYIFTVDAVDNQGTNGLRYHIVDMNADNGNGDVTTKNELLVAPVSEKMTAARHKNGKDIWLIVHSYSGTDFYSFLISEKGKIEKPVMSTSGFSVVGATGAGQMKISPDGKMLGMALYSSGGTQMELFKFNNENGRISDAIDISLPGNSAYSYGLEFSPDSKKVYCSTSYSKQIFQYDISQRSSEKISATGTLIATTTGSFAWAMQLGPDGRIYVSHDSYPTGDSYLGVIENPNEEGLKSKYNDNGFFLGGKLSSLGLPNVFSVKQEIVSTATSEQGCGRDENGFER